MKRTLIIGLLAAALAVPGALADQVTVTWGTIHSPSGGEFILTTTGLDGTFNSFCIEKNEFIAIGGTYNYTKSNAAVGGGVLTYGGPNPDPISLGTAYLYRMFRSGTLTGYSSSSATDQSDLQDAFWILENEIAVVANPWVTLAGTNLVTNLAGLQADSGGLYGVVALNLTDASGNNQQSLLGVPDGGMTLMLLGMALAAMGFVARRR